MLIYFTCQERSARPSIVPTLPAAAAPPPGTTVSSGIVSSLNASPCEWFVPHISWSASFLTSSTRLSYDNFCIYKHHLFWLGFPVFVIPIRSWQCAGMRRGSSVVQLIKNLGYTNVIRCTFIKIVL